MEIHGAGAATNIAQGGGPPKHDGAMGDDVAVETARQRRIHSFPCPHPRGGGATAPRKRGCRGFGARAWPIHARRSSRAPPRNLYENIDGKPYQTSSSRYLRIGFAATSARGIGTMYLPEGCSPKRNGDDES